MLLTQYPSGMQVNSLLAAKNFSIHQNHIVVGNGAAELIKSLMEKISGRVGFIRPTFEEYPNRYTQENSVIFIPQNPDFSYTADDLIRFFSDKSIENLILINPDNPSGNYIPKADLLKLAIWCEEKGIRLVVDESFADFAEEENTSLIDETIFKQHPQMVVMKSISKSYGVPGIRLGILASGDEALITDLKKDVAIWNINSFGEFYLQIEEKYKNDYTAALQKFKTVRKNFIEMLRSLPGLRVIPSQANYIMAELVNGMSAKELTKVLLIKHNLLIKDLSGKIKLDNRQYIRLAVRNEQDNEKLICALREVLK